MNVDIVLFVVGLILPLYCAGYVWLIKVARTDRELYRLIEMRAGSFLLAAVVIAGAYTVIFIIADWNKEHRHVHAFSMSFICLVIAGHAMSSRGFFRAIIELPDGKQPNKQKPGRSNRQEN